MLQATTAGKICDKCKGSMWELPKGFHDASAEVQDILLRDAKCSNCLASQNGFKELLAGGNQYYTD